MGEILRRRGLKQYELPNQTTQELLENDMTMEQIQELIASKEEEFTKLAAYLYQLKYFMTVKKYGYGVGDEVTYRIGGNQRFMIVGWVEEGWLVLPKNANPKKEAPKLVHNMGLYKKV